MTLLFWVSLAVIAYTYAGYPIVMALLAHIAAKPWRKAPFSGSVSIVMAVHNGGEKTAPQLDHLLSIEPELVKQVIVVSDGSTDDTAATLTAAAATAPRLHPIILTEQGGKATALNHGIAAATGDILLFLDIRPRVAPGALPKMLANFADPSIGCVAGELVLGTAGHDGAASAVSGIYWRYEQGIRNCEAAFDSPVGVYGGFYAARRALVSSYPPGIILDDMFQPLSIIRKGARSVLEREAVVHDTWPAKVTGEFARKVRTLAGNYQLFALAPWTLTPQNRVLFQLVSHKLLRLVVPYFFATLLASATILAVTTPLSTPWGIFWTAAALAQWAFWLAAAASLKVHVPVIHRIASAAGAMLVLNIAAAAGLYKFLFTPGPLWKIWSPTNKVTEPALQAGQRHA